MVGVIIDGNPTIKRISDQKQTFLSERRKGPSIRAPPLSPAHHRTSNHRIHIIWHVIWAHITIGKVCVIPYFFFVFFHIQTRSTVPCRPAVGTAAESSDAEEALKGQCGCWGHSEWHRIKINIRTWVKYWGSGACPLPPSFWWGAWDRPPWWSRLGGRYDVRCLQCAVMVTNGHILVLLLILYSIYILSLV